MNNAPKMNKRPSPKSITYKGISYEVGDVVVRKDCPELQMYIITIFGIEIICEWNDLQGRRHQEQLLVSEVYKANSMFGNAQDSATLD